MSNLRLKIVFALFIVFFLALIARLFYWQIYKGSDLAAQARSQQQSRSSTAASRGDILASDESWLAGSGEAWLVFATLPDLKEDPKALAEALAPFFLEDPGDKLTLLQEIDRLYVLLSRKNTVWVPLKHRVESRVKEKIESMALSGIGFEYEEKRVYPEASSAAHLLGFVGKDEKGEDKGYFGLEGFYDVSLTGKSGYSARESDASGIPIVIEGEHKVSAINGVDLVTHIDKFVQLTLDKKLKEGMETYGASGGIAIVMNPKDGEILGMSSYPAYDPAKYWEFGDTFFANPSISSTFEPGSVFKVVVMASALEAGAVDPDTICECSGPLRIDKYTIETWNKVYRPGSSMTDIIVNSDNVGMVFVGRKLGSDKLFNYLTKFGIGSPTGIDLQGEANPELRERGSWSDIDLATASFGQGIAVTPIQILTAVNVIANKGVKVTPQVVGKLKKGDWVEDIKPRIDGRVISERASNEVTSMMVEAAKSGESKWTYLRGYKVAGKTGTAQIPIEGHYDEEKTIASFIGFAPSDNPKFIMLVSLREPTTSPWASETAAPLWYSIAKDLFNYFGIQPEN